VNGGTTGQYVVPAESADSDRETLSTVPTTLAGHQGSAAYAVISDFRSIDPAWWIRYRQRVRFVQGTCGRRATVPPICVAHRVSPDPPL